MSYATSADITIYTGIAADVLPADIDRLITRASEMMDDITPVSIDPNNAAHLAAAKKAVCAQVEFWLEVGEDRDISGPVEEYTASKVTIKNGQGSNRIAPAYLAPRARRALLKAGLLYAGAGVK
ncbi:MAG: hypothetical protein ABFD54_05720 [Armatimonadota bacterium]|nr:hypothetical protein [bacterium]